VNLERVAGGFLVGLPIAFNTFFLLIGRFFDYPAVLRRPVDSILMRFQAGGVQLKLIWYGFMLTAVLLAPLAVLLGQVLASDGLQVVPVMTTVGVLAAVVRFLGLARWPFLVPGLARTYANPESSPAARDSTPSTATSESQSASASATCCAWTVLAGAAMLKSSSFDAWLAWPGVIIGALLVTGSLEFVGSFEEKGWKLAGTLVPIAYTAWSHWLVVAGFVLLG
jgi:hypothetical protein